MSFTLLVHYAEDPQLTRISGVNKMRDERKAIAIDGMFGRSVKVHLYQVEFLGKRSACP